MNRNTLNKNIVIAIINNIITFSFQLITFPYISKVLSVENIGRYQFIESILNFFYLIAILGIHSYAIREGSKLKEDKEKLNKLINELFFINIITVLLSYVLMFICVENISKLYQEKSYIYLFSIHMIFYILSMDWILTIYEEYLFVTLQTFFFKVLYIIFLFLFVKESEDLFPYLIIIITIKIFSNISIIIYNKKFYKLQKICIKNCKVHLKSIFILFFSSLANMIYTSSDILILGFMSTNYIVGIYSFSVKICTTLKAFLACILITSYPRISFLYEKNINEYKKTVQYVYDATMFLAIPCVVGLLLVSEEIIFFIGNKQYIQSITSLHILSISLFFSIIAWIQNQLILLPSKKDLVIFKLTIFSAILNIILNFVFIPLLKEKATAFSTLISEFVICLLFRKYGKNIYKIYFFNKNIKDYLIGSIGICFICIIFSFFYENNFILILKILFSIIIYIAILLIRKNKIIHIKINKKLK